MNTQQIKTEAMKNLTYQSPEKKFTYQSPENFFGKLLSEKTVTVQETFIK